MFKDKLILIAGGSSGIGKATAQLFHSKGARVILLARDEEKLAKTAHEIDPLNSSVRSYSCDLTSIEELETTADDMIATHGHPDVIVLSAGAGEWLTVNEAQLDHYKQTIESPYLATANCFKAFFDRMKSKGSGHFIVVNSAGCFFSFPGASGYLASRWALLGFARAVQADLHRTKFKLSMLAFGKVDTPYFSNNPISEERIPKLVDWLVPTWTAEQAALAILKVVHKPRNMSIYPWQMRIAASLNRISPALFRRALKRGVNYD